VYIKREKNRLKRDYWRLKSNEGKGKESPKKGGAETADQETSCMWFRDDQRDFVKEVLYKEICVKKVIS
jgi:hypothetical protein